MQKLWLKKKKRNKKERTGMISMKKEADMSREMSCRETSELSPWGKTWTVLQTPLGENQRQTINTLAPEWKNEKNYVSIGIKYHKITHLVNSWTFKLEPAEMKGRVIMTHGYKWEPSQTGCDGGSHPKTAIYSIESVGVSVSFLNGHFSPKEL